MKKKQLTPADIESLRRWASALRYEDFAHSTKETDKRVQAGSSREDLERFPDLKAKTPVSSVIEYGDYFLLDTRSAENQQPHLALVMHTRRKYKHYLRSCRFKYIACICADPKATFGDYVNGYWLLPDLASLPMSDTQYEAAISGVSDDHPSFD